MSGELLLINPRRRRKSAKRKTTARRRNPIAAVKHAPKRRRNPIAAMRRKVLGRRRRNPISLGVSQKDFLDGVKQALVGASGAVAMDLIMGQINPHLPAGLQTNANNVGVGDAVKAGITVVLGKMLSKSTRGMSQRMAVGALTVQAHTIASAYLPATATVGFYSPAKVANGSGRVGPIRRGVNAFNPAGSQTPMLGRFNSHSASPMLNGMSPALRDKLRR